jgi:hypothetical protein
VEPPAFSDEIETKPDGGPMILEEMQKRLIWRLLCVR